MSTNFPASVDTFPVASTLASHLLSTDPHSTLHGNLGDALNAVETFLITTPRTANAIFAGPTSGAAAAATFRPMASADLPTGSEINVKSAPYNAVGDGVANDTTAIQNAINAAAAFGVSGQGGSVYIPPGTYKIDNIAWNPKVSIRGAGMATGVSPTYAGITTLRSNSAVGMFSFVSSSAESQGGGKFSDLFLDGNNIGTYAISWQSVIGARVERVWMQNFTQQGMVLSSCELCSFYDLAIVNCVIGVIAGVGTSGLPPTMMNFYNCRIDLNTTWAVNVIGGINWNFYGCDFEKNGTTGTDLSGGIYFQGPLGGVGLNLYGAWFDTNHGGYCIVFDTPTLATMYSTLVDVYQTSGNTTRGLFFSGTAGREGHVTSIGHVWSGNTTDVVINSANAYFHQGPGSLATGVSNTAGGVVNKFGTDQRGRTTTAPTNATATMANLSDLTSSVAAGGKYIGRAVITAKNSTAAEGLQFDFNGGTATMTSFQAGFVATPPGGAVIGVATTTALGTALTATTATAADSTYVIEFAFVVNAAGTFIPRFAEVSHTTGTATVEINSYIDIRDNPN